MGRYAAATEVSTSKSRAEIEDTLSRYGATGFRYSWQDRDNRRIEIVEFEASERHIRFVLEMPSKDDPQFVRSPGGRNVRTMDQRHKAWEQACRQRWRALALAVKAKLEMVDCGITEFEREFLGFIVDPATDKTVYQLVKSDIAANYSRNLTEHRRIGLPAPDATESVTQ